MAQVRPPNQMLEQAREFIMRCKTELKWEDLSEDFVMDIGCGVHFLCCRALLEKFPLIFCVLATDIAPLFAVETLADKFLGKYFRNMSLQFHPIDITDRSSLEEFENRISKIVCRNTLQQIANKELAFKNMYHLLKPGGHAGIMFCLANPVGSWQLKISSSKNWGQYRRHVTPLFTPANLEDNYYKNVLEDIGFRVVRCERRDVKLQFLNDQSLLTELLAIAEALLDIPADKMLQFKEESVELFKELIGYSGSGPLQYEASELLLLAIKQ
ncbi:uncharacterized protein TNCV_915431 [Trichonephila clavipes]|nr:uncharacterized protein TNCV_915431 [Trichonephila clavipes]